MARQEAGIQLTSQLQHLERQLQELWNDDVPERPQGAETLEELGTAVEELHAAADELAHAGEIVAMERRRYAELFELAPDAYAVTDIDGIILEANQAAHELLTGARGSLIGKPLAAHVEDTVGFHRRIAPLRAGGAGPVSWEALAHNGAGSLTPISVRVTAAKDLKGLTIGLRWILHDLTSRAEMEARDRAASALANQQLRDTNRRLADLERNKSEFLRVASHELRGPLALIHGYLSMVLEGDFGPLQGDLAHPLTIAFERCQTMSRLIDRMLDTARVGAGVLTLERRPVDLSCVVRAATSSLEATEAERQRLRLSLEEEPVVVHADEEQLLKAVRALVDNALKFSGDDTTVLCLVTRDTAAHRGLVVVNDRGRGIDDESRSVLFERFGRVVDRETSSVLGTGLGLFLAREIARMHGGDVQLARTKAGFGSTFILDLPLAQPVS